jgi:protein O-mannosyl-transferase
MAPPVPVRPGARSGAWPYALLIVLAGSLAYASSFNGVFVFDDIPALARNESIRSLATALQPPEGQTTSGRPVANLSFAIGYALAPPAVRDAFTADHPGGDAAVRRNARRYHAVNLAIHLAAALTLFGLVRLAFASPVFGDRLGQAATPVAAAVAALWAVHPLTTQAVTYIVQRAESLMGLFYLVTLYCAARASMARPDRRRWWTVAAVAACALGMGTKEPMITAPLLVMLWDWVFGRDATADGPRRRWPLYAALWATLAVPIAIALTGETQGRLALGLILRPEQAEAVGVGGTWTAWTYLLAQAEVVLHYLRLAFVPWPLVFDHYGGLPPASMLSVAPYAAVLVALCALSVLGLVRRHPAGFAGAWFFVILAPTSSVVPIPTEIAAEHRMYLPLAGVVALVVGSAAVWFGRRADAARSNRTPGRVRLAAGLAVAAVAVLAALTHARNQDYASDVRLWQDTVRKQPANARARYNHGLNLMTAGRFEAAAAEMEIAAALPADRETAAAIHLQLGAALSAQGRVDDGIPHLERALDLDPALEDADPILGQAYSDRGDVGRAIPHFRRAVTRRPDHPALLARTAWLLATAPDAADRDAPLAIELAERAVALTGGADEPALSSLAAAYAAAGRYEDAAGALRRGLVLVRQAGDRETEAVLLARLEFVEQAGRR